MHAGRCKVMFGRSQSGAESAASQSGMYVCVRIATSCQHVCTYAFVFDRHHTSSYLYKEMRKFSLRLEGGYNLKSDMRYNLWLETHCPDRAFDHSFNIEEHSLCGTCIRIRICSLCINRELNLLVAVLHA